MTRKPIIAASVREVVEFVLRTGDLGGGSGFAGRTRALEGTRGHQRLQEMRPAAYQAEVPVEWKVEETGFVFELKGRIDGVLESDGSLLIEEIKTVQRARAGEADPLHWAQAKIYAFLYAEKQAFPEAQVQITYVELKSGETVVFQERF